MESSPRVDYTILFHYVCMWVMFAWCLIPRSVARTHSTRAFKSLCVWALVCAILMTTRHFDSMMGRMNLDSIDRPRTHFVSDFAQNNNDDDDDDDLIRLCEINWKNRNGKSTQCYLQHHARFSERYHASICLTSTSRTLFTPWRRPRVKFHSYLKEPSVRVGVFEFIFRLWFKVTRQRAQCAFAARKFAVIFDFVRFHVGSPMMIAGTPTTVPDMSAVASGWRKSF